MRKKIYLILFGVLLGILSIEVMLQIYYAVYKTPKRNINKFETVRKKWFLPKEYYGYQINDYGIRGENIKIKKLNGYKRILCIGDSCMFGWGITNEKATIPYKLQKKLSVEHKKIEVINAGVPGYILKTAVDFYDEKLRELGPDIIIIYAGWNDLNSIFTKIDRENIIIRALQINTGIKLWRIIKGRFVIPFYRKNIYDIRNIKYSDLENELKELKRIRSITKNEQIPIYVCTLPSFKEMHLKGDKKKSYYKKIAPLLAQEQLSTSQKLDHMADAISKYNKMIRNQIPREYLIDLESEFDNKIDETYFLEGYHPSEKGIELITDYIIKKINRNL